VRGASVDQYYFTVTTGSLHKSFSNILAINTC